LPDKPHGDRDMSLTLWPDGDPVSLGNGFGSISLAAVSREGIDPKLAAGGISVRFRHGGETIRVSGQGRTRKLKKLLQEEGIVPWMRPELPLFYAGDRLVAVADLWLAADSKTSPGLIVKWIDRPALK
jgi:tRNA(Ile)-lysidine synthase